MKKLFAVLMMFVAASVFAHAGHVHSYMGTVTMIHSTTEFMMKTTDEKTLFVRTTDKTLWLTAEVHAATLNDLKAGERVVVKMNVDGKTAASVTIGAAQGK